jgi:hypothetical protein
MEHWSFDLCDDCLASIVKTFKFPPDGFMKDGYNIISSEEEYQKVFENWKETGKWDELKYKSYEELIKLEGIIRIEYINEKIKDNFPNKPLINKYDE